LKDCDLSADRSRIPHLGSLASRIPAFCIAAAVLLENISQAIRRRILTKTTKMMIITSQKVLLPLSLLSSSPFLISSAIGIFGLISSIMLITANHTLHNFVIFAFITQHLPDFKNTSNDNNNNKVIMIGSLPTQPILVIQIYL